jgi:anti-anti-sigma factor
MVLDLSVHVRDNQAIPIVDIVGEIDVYTYPRLSDALTELINNNRDNIIINLSKVRYIDSTGLGVIANGANKLAKRNGFVTIINANPQVKKIFEVSGLLKANFKLFNDEQEAVSDLQSQG